jgi:hypothetical protein
MMHDDKRKHRRLKRNIKRAGSKHRRQDFKRALRDTPDEAHWKEENFGRYSSEAMNGNDEDATRQRAREEEE